MVQKSKLFASIIFLFTVTAQALVAPELQWRILASEHFEVIYENHQLRLAEEFARSAERAHSLLSPFFKPPSKKTIIWINDHTDSPNGLATPFPRNMIVVFPVLPGPLDSIGHYDSWSQNLITHEYAHILNMDPAEGFWTPFRFVLGSIVRPNALLPNWYLEGLAVEMETHLSSHGRLRSPYFNAIIRAFVEDNRWYDDSLALANEVAVPSWPFGMRPYFWGGLIMHEIGTRKGTESFGVLNDRYAGRVPFFLHGPAVDLLGLNYEKLFAEIRTDYETRAKKQIQTIKNVSQKNKELNPTRITELGSDIFSPTISPNGLVFAFVRINADRDFDIYILKRNSKDDNFDFAQVKRVYRGKGINRLVFTPDSQNLIFDALDTDALFDTYSDIYRLNLDSLKRETLTTQARAQQPHIDKTGNNIVVVVASGGQTQLAMLSHQQVQVLYTPPELFRVSQPSFLTDQEILFSERSSDGREVLKIYNLKSKDTRTVLDEFSPAQNAVVSQRGVLFTSSRNGVSNLYWSTPSLLAARPLTNSTTSVGQGTIDPDSDRLYFSQLTGSGGQLHTQRFPHQFELPSVQPLIRVSKPDWEEPTVRASLARADYDPLPYLVPQYWFPLFAFVPDGFFVSALTGAQDPLQKHAYFLAGNYNSLPGQVGFDGRYELAVGDGYATLDGGIEHPYYYAYDISATNTYLDLQYEFFPTRTNKDWQVGARFSKNKSDIPNVYSYEYAGPGAFIKYSNVAQKPTEISPTTGFSTSIDYQYYIGSLGNVNFPRTRLNVTKYEARLLPERHAVALSLDGYFSPRNRNVFLGTSAGGDYSLTFLSAKSQIIRGYPVGEFLGWNVGTGSLEYRFPLSDSPSDFSTAPVMMRRWHGALFVDALTAEGFYYAKDIKGARSTGFGSFFYGTGLEIRSDLTLGYHLHAMLRLGMFYGFNEYAYGGLAPYVSLSVPKF